MRYSAVTAQRACGLGSVGHSLSPVGFEVAPEFCRFHADNAPAVGKFRAAVPPLTRPAGCAIADCVAICYRIAGHVKEFR